MNDPATGIPLLEQSVQFGREVFQKDPQAAAELSEQLGRLANEIMETDRRRAAELWREAFEMLSATDDQTSRFLAAVNYAGFLAENRRLHQAETYLEEALEIGLQAGLKSSLLLNASLDLAKIYRDLGAYERGGDYLLAQMARFQEPQARHELLTATVDCYFAGKLWAKMKAACRELRQLRRHGPTPAGLYDAEMRYAVACLELGEVSESLHALKAGLKTAVQWGDHKAITKARAQTAIALNAKKDYQAGAEILHKLWGKELNDSLTARTYIDALIGMGDLDRAKKVRDQFKKSGGAPGEVARLTARLVEAGRGNALKAWEAVLRAARYSNTPADPAKGSGVFEVIGEAIDHLVELHAPGSSKRLDIARRRARLAEELRWCVPDVFSDSAWQAVTRRAQDLPAYLDAFLSEAAQASKHEDALYELERFRSQSLVNVISERSYLWRGGEDSRLTFKGRFTNENQRAQYRFAALVAMGASWQARREAAERADELDSNALTAGGIITLDVGERGLHFPQTLAEHLHEVTLANDEALVFQRTLKDRTLLWLMRHDGTIVHRALTDFTREDVSHLSAQLWSPRKGKSTDRSMSREVGEFGLVEQPVGSVEKVISQLDRRLATPLAQALQENSVKTAFFVPGTDVTNLPLDHCRTWQAANIAVSFLPTARALGFARTPRYPRSERLYLVTEQDRRRYAKDVLGKEERSVLLVIDPTGSLQYAPLEAAVVALESRQGSFDILSGAEADEQTVSQKASHVGVLHLISHGIFDDASPYRSGMFMKPGKAADALWMVAEVFSDVSAPAGRLVVLSGCETGRTQPNLVSEEVSLPAAFLAAGFAAVVASRWAVDDLSTSLLIGEFYRHWSGGGISVSTALRHASEWLRTLDKSTTLTHLQGLTERLPQLHSPLGKRAREIVQDAMVAIDKADDEPFRDPKHWAAFYVVGDGAITADSFPSQKLSLPTRKRRAARG